MNKKRKQVLLFLLSVFTFAALSGCLTATATTDTTKVLDIPWRQQWLSENGYCGETCIQCAALFYGTYISQSLARSYGRGEILVGFEVDPPYGNISEVMNKLKLTYDRWNYDTLPPQYEKFLNWMKQHVSQNHPVFFCVYLHGCDDPDYDHIIPAIGYSAESISAYSDNDTLTFYDLFLPEQSYTREFKTLYDDRDLEGNGASYDNLIPMEYDYGDAITGIVDIYNETYPVTLAVDVNNEPNVDDGADPVEMNAAISISGLKEGNRYMLLRYNDYINIPSSNFKELSDQADSVVTFTADDTIVTLHDKIMSDSMAAYRCVSN